MQAKNSDNNSNTSALRDPCCDFARAKFMLTFFSVFRARVIMFFMENELVDVRSSGFSMLEEICWKFSPRYASFLEEKKWALFQFPPFQFQF